LSSKPLTVGMIGCGTVGRGVVRLLCEHATLYQQRVGRPLDLRRVLVRPQSLQRHMEADVVDPALLTDDPDAFFAQPLDVVIEVAGGRGAVSRLVYRALEAGAHVVTANKALLASEGPELFAVARKHNVSISFEASCGGGIPCVTTLLSGLMANRVRGLYGILNGTCNYILTEMIDRGKTYEQALSEAQAHGYAEADPTMDVGGHDTSQKLALLAALAFGVRVEETRIACRGIDDIALSDVRAGLELGYDIKLLGIAEQREPDGPLSLSVEPCFIDHRALLAQVKGPFNALSVVTDGAGHVLLYGQGAGELPTASSVVSDLLNLASNMYPTQFAAMRLTPDCTQPARILEEPRQIGRYYLRFNAMDRPGTIASLTGVLGEGQISLSAVSQHEEAIDQFVPLVMLTHDTPRANVQAALDRIAELDITTGQTTLLRIVDLPC